MRSILVTIAGIAAAAALVAGINAIASTAPSWLVLALFISGAGVIVVVARRILVPRSSSDEVDSRSPAELVSDLRASGELATESFRARRCIAIGEFEDEGLTYWLELEDGRLLCLSGQYLYPYEDDPETGQPRRFPCTEFTVRSHARNNFSIDIECRGTVLEPIAVLPPFNQQAWDENKVPDDRTILTDHSLEALRDRGGTLP